MPSHIRAVEIKLPEAERLADLYGIRLDLKQAAKYCELAIEHHGEHGWQGTDLQEGLVIAAVITYARCFMRGQRNWLHPRRDLPGLALEHQENHDFYFQLRQKYVAHPVNAFEETWVTARAAELDGVQLPITSLSPGRGRIVLSASMGKELLALVHAVQACLNGPIKAEECKLLDYIGTLPPATIHAGDLRSSFSPAMSEVAKNRKRRGPRKHK